MSTLVMVEKNGIGCIAADTLTTYGPRKQQAHYVVSAEKILRVDDAFIGVVGWSAHMDVLQSVFSNGFRLPAISAKRDLFEFSRKLHNKLKDEYFLRPNDGDAYETSQMALFVLNGNGMFGMFDDRSVEQYRRFASIGSGARYALGAMHAMYDSGADAEAIATAGVLAGVEFDSGSAAPVTVEQLTLQH
ncbi:MAG: MFS transporter [Pseudomonadota bacterium]